MARLTKNQLTDKTRYQFKTEDVDLPELDDGSGDVPTVAVKTLSVKERDALPQLTDSDGRPALSVAKFAKIWAAVVADPKLTVKEAEDFLGDLPATALDKVMEKFGELLGSKEDQATVAREFPSAED